MKVVTCAFSALLSLVFSLSIVSSSFAQANATDFNQDGTSDLTTVVIQSGGDLTWQSLAPLSGLTSSQGTYGKVGEDLIVANWIGNGLPEIGVVGLNTSNKIYWRILDQNKVTQERVFGSKGYVTLAGGDFNGNGVSDGVVARLSKGQVIWTIASDMFSRPANAQRTKQVTFGLSISKIFYASPQNGRDWVGVVTKDSKGRPILRFKDSVSGSVLTSSALPSFALRTSTSRPFPVRQDSGRDLIGFSRVSGNSTVLNFFRTTGRSMGSTTLPVTGDVVVGNFNAEPGEEVAIKKSSASDFYVYNPISKATSIIAGSTGIAVDAININAVGSASTPPSSTPTPAPTNSKPIPGAGSRISCSSVVDISSLPNVLYKNENLHGSRGRTWLDQGRRSGGVRRLVIAGLDGVVFGCFGLYACDSPYGCRYYQAMCSDPLSNSQFIGAATSHGGGSPYAYVSTGSGTCYKFKADTARYGNIIK